MADQGLLADHSEISAPQASNPPVQFFGTSSQDTSPVLPTFAFTEDNNDFHFDDGGQYDLPDGKRRRIAKACDMCRKKKIKCDGGVPTCKSCAAANTPCAYTHIEKKRSPPKGAKYIEGLENRLARMEALLRKTGLLDAEDGEEPDLAALEKKVDENQGRGQQITLSPDNPSESSASPQSTLHGNKSDSKISAAATPKDGVGESVEEISARMGTLTTNAAGESRYLGPSAGWSIFSPKGVEWVNEKTGDLSFQEILDDVAERNEKWAYWKPLDNLFTRRIFQPLPSLEETYSLLRDFFENFNAIFPLFHEATFMRLVDLQYSGRPCASSGWWASLNCALAIAHRLRVQSGLVDRRDDQKGWNYLKNAMAVLIDLCIRNTDLLSVQALLAMASFLLGTPNPQPSNFLVAAACRLAQTIGLHKRGPGFKLGAVEVEQRNRVFWIAHMMDKDLCLRAGRAPAQDDDDMTVDLPSEDPADNVGNVPLKGGTSKFNLFRAMASFSVLQGRVYKQLYSTKASRQTDGVLLNAIGELDEALEAWKDSVPIDLRPGHDIQATHPPLILHVTVLHFSYFNCLATIHRMAIDHGYWTNRLSDYALRGLNSRALNPRVFSSAALCVTAARGTIDLIKNIPQGDNACVWLIIYFPISAVMSIFAHILQNPQDSHAPSDADLIHQVVEFLSLVSLSEEQSAVNQMLGLCSELEAIARRTIDKAEKRGRHKRKDAGKMTSPDSGYLSHAQLTPGKVSGAHNFGHQATVESGEFGFSPALDSASVNAAVTRAQLAPLQQSFMPTNLWDMETWDWSAEGLNPNGPAEEAVNGHEGQVNGEVGTRATE